MPDLPKLGDRARKLKRLSEHEGWAELGVVHRELRARNAERLANRLLQRGAKFDQREVDYQAGFFAGMKALLDNPEKVGDTLERALRRVDSESR